MSKRGFASEANPDMGSGERGDSEGPPVSKKIKGSDHNSKNKNSSSNVKVLFEPLQLGAVSNLDELEVKTLKFQNHKLGQRLNHRLVIEEELRGRIDQLEKRQTQDDAVINVIHRYWNQLNEDMRILLQRFDAETGDEEEKNEESEATTSFLNQLATWHKQELDEKLASRVQVSQRAVGKIIQVFDHMIQRNERLSKAIRGDDDTPNGEVQSPSESSEDKSSEKKDKTAEDSTANEKEASEKSDPKEKPTIDDQVKDWNAQLVKENKSLHRLNTSLHEKNHFLSLKQAEFEELINAEKIKNEELQNKLDDLEYELNKCKVRNGKLETVLIDTQVCRLCTCTSN